MLKSSPVLRFKQLLLERLGDFSNDPMDNQAIHQLINSTFFLKVILFKPHKKNDFEWPLPEQGQPSVDRDIGGIPWWVGVGGDPRCGG